ncbi:SHOCT domain-containing protein [Liquorilactobacillus hordei]
MKHEIKKFKELADSGVITQEEFEAKKKKILRL